VDQPTIGDNLALLRRMAPMTQEELAEAAGVSVETIRKLEHNKNTSARMSTLRKPGSALGVPTSRLIGNAARTAAEGSSDVDELDLLDLRRVLTPALGLNGLALAGPEFEAPALTDYRGGNTLDLVDRELPRREPAQAGVFGAADPVLDLGMGAVAGFEPLQSADGGVGDQGGVAPAVTFLEQAQLGAGVRPFPADDDPYPVWPAGRGEQAGQLGDFGFLPDAAVGGQRRRPRRRGQRGDRGAFQLADRRADRVTRRSGGGCCGW